MSGFVAAAEPDAKTAGNLVFDLDGVVYLDGAPIPGAGAALAELERRGYRILFVTNNSTRTAAAVAGHITELTGFATDPAAVLTSGMAATVLLEGRARTVLVVGEPGLAATLTAAGFTVGDDPAETDAVVVGLDRHFDYARLRAAATAVRNGAVLVATNSDPTYPTQEGLWPGGGAMVAAIETAAETTAEVAGKPHPTMRRLVARHLGAGATWVVGDRADTDLEMARAEGWHRILVLSGATPDASGLEGEHRPDLVLRSIAELPAALG